MTADKADLRECPFCGSDHIQTWPVKHDDGVILYTLRCQGCHQGFDGFESREKMIELWDTRSPLKQNEVEPDAYEVHCVQTSGAHYYHRQGGLMDYWLDENEEYKGATVTPLYKHPPKQQAVFRATPAALTQNEVEEIIELMEKALIPLQSLTDKFLIVSARRHLTYAIEKARLFAAGHQNEIPSGLCENKPDLNQQARPEHAPESDQVGVDRIQQLPSPSDSEGRGSGADDESAKAEALAWFEDLVITNPCVSGKEAEAEIIRTALSTPAPADLIKKIEGLRITRGVLDDLDRKHNAAIDAVIAPIRKSGGGE